MKTVRLAKGDQDLNHNTEYVTQEFFSKKHTLDEIKLNQEQIIKRIKALWYFNTLVHTCKTIIKTW